MCINFKRSEKQFFLFLLNINIIEKKYKYNTLCILDVFSKYCKNFWRKFYAKDEIELIYAMDSRMDSYLLIEENYTQRHYT